MNPLKYEEGYELYELVLSDDEDGTFALSLVSAPAIQQDFCYFGKNGKIEVQFATTDTSQRSILGPILIPDIKILRLTDEGDPYFVTFKKDTVKEIAQKYIKDNNSNNVTIEHKKPTNAVSLVESWVVDSPVYDKSRKYGLAIKPGTWMGIFKVHNGAEGDKIWNEYIKTGKLKGISLEGLFTHNLIKASKVDWMEKSLEHLSEEESEILLEKIRSLIQMESYTDYPDSVKNNAKKGRELNEKNGNKCATQVGKVRSAQLEAGEPITLETIKRMYSFLSRAETYYDNADSENDCGNISFLLWGGKAGLSWSRNKLRELGELEETEAQPSIPNSTYPGEVAKKKKEEDLAEVGPRGGIRKSPKAPKSDTPNPNPKGEGTAKGDASGKRGAKVSAEDEKTLENKVKEFNEKDSNTKNGRATLGALKSVFQRGLGAYNTSHSPRVSSPSQWAFARVNAFLYLLKNGRPQNPKYTSDYDLLPKEHPKAT